MKRAILLLVALLTAIGGCATSVHRPECHGPWSPINLATADDAHG